MSEVVVQLTPYPASFIIEHAKRRTFAAGYIIGTRTEEEIIITDFIPLTHADTDAPSTKAYRDDVHRLSAAKRRLTKQGPIGWYTAGRAGDLSEGDYQRLCNAPVAIFHRRSCLHLHGEMPDPASDKPEIAWTASIISEDPEDHKLKYSEHKVILGAVNSVATDVMLNHIISQVLFNGGHAYERSKLLNIDEVAYIANLENRSSTDAVNEEQRKLQGAVAAAEHIVTGGSGTSKEAHEKMSAIENFRAIREEALQRQREQSGRVDFNSEQFKDALMIKCAATLLRKEVSAIEMLSTAYSEEKERKPNAEGGEEGAAKEQQQQGAAAQQK